MHAKELKKRLAQLTQEERDTIKFNLVHGKEEDGWGYIYVIKCGEFYKIGRAWNLDSRFASLQVGNPQRLEIVYATKHPRDKDIEALLHEEYAQKRERGEWFRLTREDLFEIVGLVENSWKRGK